MGTAQQARPKVIGHRLPVRAQFTSLSRLATTKPLSAISPVIPLTTASCAGPGGSRSRLQASGSGMACSCCRGGTPAAVSVCALIGDLLPVQGALAPFVEEPD